MIDVVKVWQALIAKEDLFEKPIAELAQSLSIFEQAQASLTTLPLAEIDEKLSKHAWPGARLTKEFEIYPSLIVPSKSEGFQFHDASVMKFIRVQNNGGRFMS